MYEVAPALMANEALADAIKQSKRASFLSWLAEGGLPDLTGPAHTEEPSAGAQPSGARLTTATPTT